VAAFTLWATLTPLDRTAIPQQCTPDPVTGKLYMAQKLTRSGTTVDDLTIGEYQTPTGTMGFPMSFPGGGHGDVLTVENVGGVVFLGFWYTTLNAAQTAVVDSTWVRVPFVANTTMNAAAALAYASTPPAQTAPTPGGWLQGETIWGARTYRSYGGAYDANGAIYTDIPPYVQIIEGGRIVGRVDTSKLGRDSKNVPIGGRLEPEGIAVYISGTTVNLLYGMAIRRKGSYQLQLYLYPIDVLTVPPPPPGAILGTGTLSRFLVCDSLSLAVVGQLQPSAFELTDVIDGPGTAALALPLNPSQKLRLEGLTRPRMRFLAVVDTGGVVLWCGPFTKRGTFSAGAVNVQAIDWRGWFYRAQLRPGWNGIANSLIALKVVNTEQTTILSNLAKYALADPAAPRIIVDPPTASGVRRDFSSPVMDRTIGDMMDEISGRERGADWWTYGVLSDDQTKVTPHLAFGFPERSSRRVPIRLEWRDGTGGNVSDVSWPDTDEGSTRVWAVGTGDPPAQVVTKDQFPELLTGTELLWEGKVGPLDGVTKKATAYEYAYAKVQEARRLEGTAEFGVSEERLKFSTYTVGDRARVILDNGWDVHDIPAARITQRTLKGGRKVPIEQRLTVDLGDQTYPDAGGTPGLPVDVAATP
jgi:hypothetical protein